MNSNISKFINSSRSSVFLGYIAQFFSAVVAIAYAPYILGKVGPEAYGLVGIFMIAQSLFHLLDAGLTPTIHREAARFKGGATSGIRLRTTIRGLETIIAALVIPLILITYFLSDSISKKWLQRETITADEVATTILIMMVIFCLRWMTGIRKGVLLGFEHHKIVSSIAILIAILRYPLIPFYFSLVEPSATSFFLYQLFISIFEVITYWLLARMRLPVVDGSLPCLLECVASLRRISGFALNHAFVALLTVLVTQVDKIILSQVLTLKQFGYLTLALTAAGGIRLISQPIGQVLKSRLSKLHSIGDLIEFNRVYRLATRTAVFLLSGITVIFLFYGEEIMYLWTGDWEVARETGIALSLYSLGNCALGISTFVYYVQFATGRLRLHTIGSVLRVIIMIPCTYYATIQYGVVGAGSVWALLSVSHLLIWATYTHTRILKDICWRWLFRDVLAIFLPSLITAALLSNYFSMGDEKISLAITIATVFIVVSIIGFIFSGLYKYIGSSPVNPPTK